MIKYVFLYFFVTATWLNAPAQHEVLSGRLMDTSANSPCVMALVSILNKDSTAIQFTYSDKVGNFKFSVDLPSGIYLVLIEDPSYMHLYIQWRIDGSATKDLGTVALKRNVDSLQPVTITPSDFRPHFLKDTLEYYTSNIKMNVNANIEELIGRLPGLQVNQDGSITYNGQKIQQVLVDGKELSSDDLRVVTRNLDANMIAKIQVLDDKSKQSKFTSIDDGQRIKTLNLVLKHDRRNEYLIKAGAGTDMTQYYQAGGMLGAFKGSDQLLAVGMAANNGFSETSDGMVNAMIVTGATNDPLGASAQGGVSQVAGGSVQYNTDLGGAKNPISLYYRNGSLDIHPVSSGLTEQILSDSIYIQKQQSNSVNSHTEQALDGNFTDKLDSFSAITGRFVFANTHGHNQLNTIGSSTFNDTLVNTSIGTINSDVSTQYVGGSFGWTIRARKEDKRRFSIFVRYSDRDNITSGYLYAQDQFYQGNAIWQSADTTDQRKAYNSSEVMVDGRITYTQPLWNNLILGLAYSVSVNHSHQQQLTYSRDDGKYDDLVDSLSADYQDIFFTQHSGITLQSQNDEYDFVMGADILQYNYREQDKLDDTIYKNNNLNFAPRIIFNLHPNPIKGYSFTYNGSTQLPSITQLEPVQNNTNPLYITLGNPDLHPSYTHAFSLDYHNLKAIQFNLGLSAGIIMNSISTKTYTDILGRQISQQVNTSGSGNAGANFSLNKRLKPWDLDVGVSGSVNYDRAVNYINDILAVNKSYNVGGGLSIAKYVANVYSFRINSDFGYSTTTSSVNTGAVVGYWTQNHVVEMGFFPMKDMEISTNCNYTWRQKTSIFDNNNSVLLWNAFVNRNLLDNQLTARFQVNDILGQNAGISRSISANQISQTNSNVIGRYWMVSLVYHFTHKFKSR